MKIEYKSSIDGVVELGKCLVCGAEITTILLSDEVTPLPIRCSVCGYEYIRVV